MQKALVEQAVPSRVSEGYLPNTIPLDIYFLGFQEYASQRQKGDKTYPSIEDKTSSLSSMRRGLMKIVGGGKFVDLTIPGLRDSRSTMSWISNGGHSKTCIFYFFGWMWQDTKSTFLAVVDSGRTKKSHLNLSSVVRFLSERYEKVLMIFDVNVSGRFNTEGFSCLFKSAGNVLSVMSYDAARRDISFSQQLGSLLLSYTKTVPSFRIEDTLRLLDQRCRRSGAALGFSLHGNRGLTETPLYQAETYSVLYYSDLSNLTSHNLGSREDGLQALSHLARQSRFPYLARFALEHFSANDPAATVRHAANRLLDEGNRVWSAPLRHATKAQVEAALPVWQLVPAGAFLMGSNQKHDEFALPAEMPHHLTYLDDFFVGQAPVSELAWSIFEAVHSDLGSVDFPNRILELKSKPVISVSWYDAMAFAEWLSAEAKWYNIINDRQRITLPSEAQWECAARGRSGRLYPWGNEFQTDSCNYRDSGINSVVASGSYSPQGDAVESRAQDMAGNVWEWTRSNWGTSGTRPDFSYPYDAKDGREDEQAPPEVRRVIRGGAHYYFDYCLRCATRNVMYPETRHSAGGFRLILCEL